eukprot:5406940-Pyramimonas_sp.AAC.1
MGNPRGKALARARLPRADAAAPPPPPHHPPPPPPSFPARTTSATWFYFMSEGWQIWSWNNMRRAPSEATSKRTLSCSYQGHPVHC